MHGSRQFDFDDIFDAAADDNEEIVVDVVEHNLLDPDFKAAYFLSICVASLSFPTTG